MSLSKPPNTCLSSHPTHITCNQAIKSTSHTFFEKKTCGCVFEFILPPEYSSTHNERDPETHYDHREARQSDSDYALRFMGVDALAGKYPSLSPYCYVGGNPIRLVDMDGRYQLPADVAQNYKVFASYLNDGIKEILESPNIMAGLKKYGQLTEEKIKEIISPNSGPRIELKNDIPFGGDGYYPGGKDSNIQISITIISQLENASEEDKQAALLLVVSTLLHETVHYGDWQDNDPDDNQESLSKLVSIPCEGVFPQHQGSEKGQVFESEVYRNYEWGTTILNIIDAKTVISEKSKTSEGKKDLPTVPK